MTRATRPRSILTVGSLLRDGEGVTLRCACGHRTALLPTQVAALAHPETPLLDFKRRFRCSMCGASGSGNGIRLTTFAVAPALAGDAPLHDTPSRSRH